MNQGSAPPSLSAGTPAELRDPGSNSSFGEIQNLSRVRMNGWTGERRTRQAALIREWKPWQRSTGPRTAAGKARAARNAFKNSPRQQLREIARFVASIKQKQNEVLARFRQ